MDLRTPPTATKPLSGLSVSLWVPFPALDPQVSTGSTANLRRGTLSNPPPQLQFGTMQSARLRGSPYSCALLPAPVGAPHLHLLLIGSFWSPGFQPSAGELPEPLTEKGEAVHLSSTEHGITTTAQGRYQPSPYKARIYPADLPDFKVCAPSPMLHLPQL